MAAVPQFGEPEPGRAYPDRPAVFGIVERGERIALVRIEKPGSAPWHDLPGGALDPGEDEAEALVREFGEETGLVVEPTMAFARADQYFVNTEGKSFNNRAGFWTATATREDAGLKSEDDHTLVWLEPQAALAALRHDAHGWAVAAWLRRVKA